MKKILLLFVLVSLILASGCIEKEETVKKINTEDLAVQTCIEICEGSELDLNLSPCLSNDLLGDRQWVCDVAHSPRLPMDNLPENQCEAWLNHTASHFVELDPECKLIKKK